MDHLDIMIHESTERWLAEVRKVFGELIPPSVMTVDGRVSWEVAFHHEYSVSVLGDDFRNCSDVFIMSPSGISHHTIHNYPSFLTLEIIQDFEQFVCKGIDFQTALEMALL